MQVDKGMRKVLDAVFYGKKTGIVFRLLLLYLNAWLNFMAFCYRF